MSRLTKLYIRGYRSIKDGISIKLSKDYPLILIGENNTGKSNIIRALDLILGERWPGTREPEDHEFWDRDPKNIPIEIRAYFDGLNYIDKHGQTGGKVKEFLWKYDAGTDNENKKCKFELVVEHGNSRWVNTLTRDQCICVVVSADRRLSYQLSYATSWTMLSKLMRKFHAYLTSDLQKITNLKKKFEEVKAIFEEVKEFADFQNDICEQVDTMLAGMTYGLQIDFSAYDPSHFFHSLRVVPHEGGQPRTFEEVGTGQEQILALAFAHAYAKAFYAGIILAIEEPEVHLHPLAQRWLAKNIYKMAKDGLQVIITTHSPAFVNLLGLESVVLVRKINNATIVTQLDAQNLTNFCIQHEARQDRTSVDTILPFYASNATPEIISGLFGKKVVLVEGQTEQLALPIYLGKVGLDVLKEGISIISVMGKGNIAKWWRFFQVYDLPAYIIFDNDADDDVDANKRRDALGTIGMIDDETTNVTSTEEWIVGDRYCVFGMDFERTLKKYFQKYLELENKAKTAIGDAKPLVARYVAENLQLDNEKGWEKFSELKDKIRGL